MFYKTNLSVFSYITYMYSRIAKIMGLIASRRYIHWQEGFHIEDMKMNVRKKKVQRYYFLCMKREISHDATF